MLSLHSPQKLVALAVPLTAAALILGACSANDSSDSDNDTVLGEVAEDGTCDPDVISLTDPPAHHQEAVNDNPDQDHLTIQYMGDSDAPDAYVEAEAISDVPADPDGPPRDGTITAGFPTPGGEVTLSLGNATLSEISHLKITATLDDGGTETCTIDVE